tara:strand:- start:1788 stop:1967 length:180 start_codon:yes stop_codon:yes gene_type:complete
MNSIDFELVMPTSIKDLRSFIISQISQKGELIRWSIYEIANSKENLDQKILKINAIIIN